ncbi:hypothetical protein ACFO0M_06175 [Micromonospora mangrovi]|uniref:Uncharacterized protein n=2 Tax=Micromonospora TaxID=1873 RepID=A0AAU7M9C9_9ACTN
MSTHRPVVAERLLLLDRVGWFVLARPVLIEAGQTYRVDHEANELHVDRGAGRSSRIPGRTCR